MQNCGYLFDIVELIYVIHLNNCNGDSEKCQGDAMISSFNT